MAPKLVVFLVILVIGWIVAKLLAKGVTKLLSLIGFDRAIERGGLRRWTGTYDPSQLFAKLVYYAVLLIALQMAFGVFGPNPVSDIINSIVAFLPMAFVALVIVVITAAIANAVKDIITGALGGLSYSRVLGTVAQVFILALGSIAALNQVGIAMTVTMPVLITVLATIGGVVVVGVGGGLIQPMR
ncbi:MAG: mechanosensitive ion channel family protein, partial [Dehalococcoidia bacterium]